MIITITIIITTSQLLITNRVNLRLFMNYGVVVYGTNRVNTIKLLESKFKHIRRLGFSKKNWSLPHSFEKSKSSYSVETMHTFEFFKILIEKKYVKSVFFTAL